MARPDVRLRVRPLWEEALNAIQFATAAGLLSEENSRRLASVVADIERELEVHVDSEVSLVREVSRHTLRAGGKRLRPVLVYLAASTTGRPFAAERTIRLGACMELIHMATLMHDDVIDHAVTRRGIQTASSVFGNTASILTGDVLLAKAMRILAEDGDLRIIRMVSQTVVDLAEGEVDELDLRSAFDVDEETHLQVLRRKTATFIATCCAVGGVAAGATLSEVDALYQYGYHLGLAFQVADDLLDYRGESDVTGKPRATDFREGCATLPLIKLVKLLSDSEREMVAQHFGSEPSEAELDTIIGWMADRGAFTECDAFAQSLVQRGIESLEQLPESEDQSLLKAVALHVVCREA